MSWDSGLALLRRALLPSAVIVFIAAALFLGTLINQREASLAETSRYNLQWSASQSVIELTRLHTAVGMAAMSPSDDFDDEVRLRFDILMNRMRLLENGEFRAFTRTQADMQAIVDEAGRTLAQAGTPLQNLDEKQGLVQVHRQLSPLIGQFIALAATANRVGAEQVVVAQSELRILHWLFSGMVLTLLAAGAIQFRLLLRSKRLLQSTHDQLALSNVQLREAHDLAEAASKAKSEFLAKMSHEIRTPMNGIMGMSEILSHTRLSDRQGRLLETIRTSANTLLTIINDILDLSRIEAGKMEVDEQVFNMRSCVEGAVELVSEQAFRKGVELTLLIDNDVPELVRGDAVRLRQIAVNIVGNAVKFTELGEVAVRVGVIELRDGRAEISFEVRDTGIGIEPQTQKRLFRAFSQADNSSRRKFGGTGLGLTISRHLVEMLGGRITLASTLGLGTTVSFSLPFKIEVAASGEHDADQAALAGLHVLVVDDRSASREVYKAYLESCAMRTNWASSPEQALVLLDVAHERGDPYHAVVVDRLKPGQNGFGLADRIRLSPQHAQIPVILAMAVIWSGHGDDTATTADQSVIAKPIRRAELIKVLRQAIQRNPAAAPHSMASAKPAQPLPKAHALHVLVAEDNPVNVEVARAYLEAGGYTCDTAATGREAVTAWEHGVYVAILMDCQMPEMDGLTATRAIREREKHLGRQRIPIIAVTANAFTKDREDCLSAGMDDYMSKPFSEGQLRACLDKWTLAITLPTDGPAATLGVPAAVLEDTAKPGARSGKVHAELNRRHIRVYRASARASAEELRSAVRAGDADGVRHIAHTLKSGSASVGAFGLAALCARIEELSAHGQFESASQVMLQVRAELEHVLADFGGAQAAAMQSRVA